MTTGLRYPGGVTVTRVAGLTAALLLVAACGGARSRSDSSRPQVVFLGVEGARDPRVDARVEELVNRRFDIIDRDTYFEEARSLGAEKMTRKNIAKVATSLGAVAFVHGSARGKSKRRQSVTIFVREPKGGKIKERYKLSVRHGVLAKKSDRALEKRLLVSVKAPVAPPPTEPTGSEDDEVATQKSTKDDEAAAKSAPPKGAPPTAEEDEDPPPAVEYDGSGQAIDDEMPPM